MQPQERSLLARGLKFCPTPNTPDYSELHEDINEFCRKLRIKEFFHNKPVGVQQIVKAKSGWVPQSGRNPTLDCAISNIKRKGSPENNGNRHLSYSVRHNLKLREREAIGSLTNSDLIIKEADKGSAVVLMDRQFYILKIMDLLKDKDTYVEIPNNIDRQTINKIKKTVNKYKNNLTKEESKFLTNFEYRTSLFYGLPKVHKSTLIIQTVKDSNSEYICVPNPSDLKLRPIVAGPSCPTHRLSHLLDILLQPFLKLIPAYLKNNLEFLNTLPPTMKDSEIFITLDVVSLYSNISHDLGYEAIEYWVTKYNNGIERIPSNLILEGCMLVLENNSFEFNNTNYLQISGTAMGTKFAPNYANLVLGYLEHLLFYIIQTKFSISIAIKFRKRYKRYLDDVFIIWDKHDGEFEDVLDIMNDLNHKIKFTWDSRGDNATFLDIKLTKRNNAIITDIFYKETDTKQYLEFNSNHPRHVKNNIPFNLARRICTIVTEPQIREERLRELKDFLSQRKYPDGLISNGILKAMKMPLAELRSTDNCRDISKEVIPFITTHNPLIDDNYKYIQSNYEILQKNPETSDIFEQVKLIRGKRQPPNLKRLLTKARLPSDIPLGGVSTCNQPRCKLCEDIIVGDKFIFAKVGATFSIRSRMNCNVQNCIYVLCCNGCDKIYIGETTDFRSRVNLHRNHIKQNKGLGVSLHIHQCTQNTEPKFSIMPFYKVKSDNIAIRREKESFFIKKIKPDLNVDF